MDAEELSAEIALKSQQLKDSINNLIEGQEDIQHDILELQMRKREGQTIDEALLAELKESRNETSEQISMLAMMRTELFDDLPVIRVASGKIKVITEELNKDAKLIETTAKRIQDATKAIGKAEKFLVNIIKLAAKIP